MRLRSLAFLVPLAFVTMPNTAAAAPLFVDATANLGSPQPCANSNEGCYSHYVLLVDLDADGDLDAVFANGGGYYTPGNAAPLAAYLNDSQGQFIEVGASAFGGFAGRIRQITAGDIDGDGDIDLFAPDAYGMQPDAMFVNDGQSPPKFTHEGQTRMGTSSRLGGARFGDLDNDGDIDLIVTDWGSAPPNSAGTAHVYLNDGTGFFQEKPDAVPQNSQAIGTGPIDADLFDADGDFDLDLVLASRKGESLFFRNDGTGTFVDANGDFPDQPGPYVYGPDVCDVDADGDLDVWLDNGASNLLEQLFINDGTGVFKDETATRITGNPGADDNEVQCADIDGDGDFDVVIASLSNDERVLVNDGTGHFTLADGAFPAVGDSTLGLDLGDVNGDGILDAITAQGELGNFLNHLYLGISPQPVDGRPPVFRAVEALPSGLPGGARVVRFAVSDASTTDMGPRLTKAFVEIEAAGGVAEAHFIGGDLFRAMFLAPSDATVRYRACATDRRENQTCSAWSLFTTVGGSGSGGEGGAAGSSGAGGAGGTNPAAGGAGGASGGGGGKPDLVLDDGGCGCKVMGHADTSETQFLMLVFGAVGIVARRIRASSRKNVNPTRPT